ncbi:type III-B CRISPR module RAMP protein Cmr4 [Tengunoibacter tsumagoiensis]|uniref:Type III-B CRISPR module RAMP protein Cmr4 n=1 Tax=Tengunoibacter tsumagoiensis TaxID=2014871 RepID=A0A402A9K5_9CHLR|nr:type III-B CRISPR module RAMP protein Cmr4 [Tengunoibacter tsumagoiensis]GCE15842.1 type III-B CRISPR module RAMP protein Cmr4 [Tengunoibacter tsumagoiensis]
MITDTAMLYLYVETPLHAGVGSGLSSIDLPIQRERTTQYPTIQGSGIKGKLRAAAGSAWKKDEEKDDVAIVFGPEQSGADHAGALIAGDARLLLFPVRSLNGVFAYTTSRDVLYRFLRDRSRGRQPLPWKELPEQVEHLALVPKRSRITAEQSLVLEEFSFDAEENDVVTDIATWLADNVLPRTPEYAYWRTKLKESLVILPENDFRDFVVNATEIITRIRIDRDTKTVKSGALWTEEHLPADTLLYVPMYATNARHNTENKKYQSQLQSARHILDKARTLVESQQGYLQLGGDETVGRGIVRMHWN